MRRCDDAFRRAVGARLFALRKARGYSLSDVQERADISRVNLWQIEKGQTAPGATIVAALCRLYGVSADWVLFGEAR